MMSHKHSLLGKYSLKIGPPKVLLSFFRIAGTSEAEMLVSGKAECLLAMGKDKK